MPTMKVALIIKTLPAPNPMFSQYLSKRSQYTSQLKLPILLFKRTLKLKPTKACLLLGEGGKSFIIRMKRLQYTIPYSNVLYYDRPWYNLASSQLVDARDCIKIIIFVSSSTDPSCSCVEPGGARHLEGPTFQMHEVFQKKGYLIWPQNSKALVISRTLKCPMFGNRHILLMAKILHDLADQSLRTAGRKVLCIMVYGIVWQNKYGIS